MFSFLLELILTSGLSVFKTILFLLIVESNLPNSFAFCFCVISGLFVFIFMIFNNEFHLFKHSFKFGCKFSDLEGDFLVEMEEI